MTPRGGLYWGKPTDDVIKALKSWDTVILNEANWHAIAPELRGTVRRVGVSFARSVWVDANGRPSAYWPVQQRIHEAARIFGGWVYDGNRQPVETTPVPRAWLYDLTNEPFRRRLSEIIATFCKAERPDLLMFDELHRGLVGIPYGESLIPSSRWTACARAFLRNVGSACGGAAPAIGTNGTLRKVDAPGMIKWHYWQNVGTHPPVEILKDRAYYDGEIDLVLHCCAPGLTREAAQVLADQVRASCWDWQPAPGMAFDRVYS